LQQKLRQNFKKHIKIAKTATKSHTHTKLQKLRQTNTQKHKSEQQSQNTEIKGSVNSEK
jgi:hypothetical protein